MSASPPPRLTSLIERATRADGSPPFSDGALLDPARELVWLGPAAAIVSDGEAEFVVDPDARRQGHGAAMLSLLLETGDRLFWAHGDHPAARALALSHGLSPVRTLLHLEAPVPVPSAPPSATAPPAPPALPKRRSSRPTSAGSSGSRPHSGADSVISEGGGADSVISEGMRGFRPADADAWLALNARAFAHHPEQGGVTRGDLDALTAEPWFAADDFLLLLDGAELVGYCWLKVTDGEGEFYVVGVSPDRQGAGLGRVLMDAGFARLASRGIRMSHLYVEADNAPALALYKAYGFTRRTTDVQYRRTRS